MVVAEISRLIGTSWTNQHGHNAPLDVGDFMVVAPYNDQVHLLRDYLEFRTADSWGDGGNG